MVQPTGSFGRRPSPVRGMVHIPASQSQSPGAQASKPWIMRFPGVLLWAVPLGCLSLFARLTLIHDADRPITNPLAVATEPMPVWAKLYPGAVPDTANVDTTRLMGLTSWDTPYTVKATTADVDAFYRETASEEGFTEVRNIGGDHFFENASNDTKFSYMVFPDGDQLRVIFQARTFDPPAKSQ